PAVIAGPASFFSAGLGDGVACAAAAVPPCTRVALSSCGLSPACAVAKAGCVLASTNCCTSALSCSMVCRCSATSSRNWLTSCLLALSVADDGAVVPAGSAPCPRASESGNAKNERNRRHDVSKRMFFLQIKDQR